MKYKTPISHNTILRLPRYLHLLEEMQGRGQERTSSTEMAIALGMTPSQVRQDLAAFGNYGAQGYGYNIPVLLQEVKKILGLHIRHTIAVVGTGCIGRAMLEHLDYESYNYKVLAAFDVREDVIGTEINGVPVYDAAGMEAWFADHDVDICILAVPAEKARSVAKQLSRYGMPAIWNFTNVDLTQKDMHCVVQNVDFRNSLFTLTYYLENKT